MGLDMYLNRMPRYKGTTAQEVYVIEEYLNWQKEKAEGFLKVLEPFVPSAKLRDYD